MCQWSRTKTVQDDWNGKDNSIILTVIPGQGYLFSYNHSKKKKKKIFSNECRLTVFGYCSSSLVKLVWYISIKNQ